MVIQLNIVMVLLNKPILYFTVFAGCYYSPSVILESSISATNECKSSPRKGKNKQLTVGTPLGKADQQSGAEMKTLIFYAFIFDMPVRITSSVAFASRKKCQ